jgi:diguanylate cyclase (GGDEF)-like protein
MFFMPQSLQSGLLNIKAHSQNKKMPPTEPALPKLLCLDDDPVILAAVVRLMKKDFQILQASNGAEGLTLLKANPDIAIVLTDYLMPGMSGLEFLAQVQKEAPDTVRAILSGQIDSTAMVEAINTARIHRLILKPWDNDYFRLQMLEALAIHQTLRERSLLEELSFTDSLTHLKNRRYFQDRIKAESERAIRHGRTLALIMIDIDYFKQFNDKFGHPAGDRLLKSVAKRLGEQVRSIDTVARYGGEEFAVLLPDTTLEGAIIVAERMRLSFVKTEVFTESKTSGHIAISLGVATIPQHASTAFDLIEKADAALYQAKRQGRNQTASAPVV